MRAMTTDEILAAVVDATDTVGRALDAVNALDRREHADLYESRALLPLLDAHGALQAAELAIAPVADRHAI